jgi:hypothetical protein
MILEKIDGDFCICKLEKLEYNLLNNEYTFVSRTDKELSLICLKRNLPKGVIISEDGWKCFRIAEDAAFEKYGMIAFLTKIVAAQKTGVLVVATFDTDYLLIKDKKFTDVCSALEQEGCHFI